MPDCARKLCALGTHCSVGARVCADIVIGHCVDQRSLRRAVRQVRASAGVASRLLHFATTDANNVFAARLADGSLVRQRSRRLGDVQGARVLFSAPLRADSRRSFSRSWCDGACSPHSTPVACLCCRAVRVVTVHSVCRFKCTSSCYACRRRAPTATLACNSSRTVCQCTVHWRHTASAVHCNVPCLPREPQHSGSLRPTAPTPTV